MFEKCDWKKYLINIHKHNYQSNNTFATIVLLFSFLSCDHNICILIVTRLFKEDVRKCSFFSTDNDGVAIKKGHKYYTQVISQMKLSTSHWGYFIVWTTKDSFFETVGKKSILGKSIYQFRNFFKRFVIAKLLASTHWNFVVLAKTFC